MYPKFIIIGKKGCWYSEQARNLVSRKQSIYFWNTSITGKRLSAHKSIPSSYHTWPKVMMSRRKNAPWIFIGGYTDLSRIIENK